MNPNGGEKQPQFEAKPIPLSEGDVSTSPETAATSSPENRPQLQPAQISSQVASDLALPSQAIATSDDSTNLTTAQPQVSAADSDRIEKEWIDRAKTIVARTADDPFTQKNEMSKVKAEYIKKRFNKTVKTSDK